MKSTRLTKEQMGDHPDGSTGAEGGQEARRQASPAARGGDQSSEWEPRSGGRRRGRRTGIRRHRLAVYVAVLLFVSCSGDTPASPTSPAASPAPAQAPASAPAPAIVPTLTITGARSIAGRNQQLQLSASYFAGTGSLQNQTNASKWDTSNPSVATVSSTGLVTSVGFGQADIAAEFNGTTARVTLLVTAPPPPVFTVNSQGARVPGVGYGCVSFVMNGASFYRQCGGGGGGRGFNVAAINPRTGELISARHFDTWLTRDSGTAAIEMVGFINSQPGGTLLLVGVADDAGLNRDDSCSSLTGSSVEAAMAVLQNLGAKEIAGYCFRSSYALIAIKGAGVKAEGVSSNSLVTLSYTLVLPQ